MQQNRIQKHEHHPTHFFHWQGILIVGVFCLAWAGTIFVVWKSTHHIPITQTPHIITNQDRATSPAINATLPDVTVDPANMLIVGDIMLGRYVETFMEKNGETYPFAKLNGLLTGHDAVLGNLEGPIDTAHQQTPDGSLHFSFPPSVAPLLAREGFTVLGIANNHGLDQGAQGVVTTKKALQDVNIDPFGNASAASQEDVLVKSVNGHEIVFIGLQAVSSSFSEAQAVSLIQTERQGHPDAFLLVFPHWGTEYQTTSNQRQRTLAHTFIDAGADAIFGHHPHVVEEVEVYKSKAIFYSLGNFIFDQYFSADTQEGLAIEMTLQDNAVSYRLKPLQIAKSQPAPFPPADASVWLSAFSGRCAEVIRSAVASGVLTLAR